MFLSFATNDSIYNFETQKAQDPARAQENIISSK